MANNVIEIKITAKNSQALAALKEVATAAKNSGQQVKNAGSQGANAFDGAAASSDSFIGKLGKVGVAVTALYGLFLMLKSIVSTVFGEGFNFNKDMELNQLGMAGILQSMALINGQAIEFNQALQISGDMMKQLQKDALRTSASTEELVNTFRAVLAPGLNAGMSLDQIRQLSVVGVNAIKSLKVPAQQVVQEMRDLIQGGITASGSTLATALGIKDSDIEKAKGSAGGLFNFLMERMQGFQATSERYPDTMAGKIDQLKEMWTMASAQLAKVFDEPIKKVLDVIADNIGTIDQKTGELKLNPEFSNAINELKNGLKEIKEYVNDISPSFEGWNSAALPILKSFWNIIKNLCSVLLDLGRIVAKITEPFRNFAVQGVRDLANDIEWLTGKIRDLLNVFAFKVGVKSGGTPQGISDYRKSEDTNSLPDSNKDAKITAKFQPKTQEMIKAEEDALKMAIDTIKSKAKQRIDSLNNQIKELEVRQSQTNDVGIYQQIAALKQQIQEIKVSEIEQSIGAVNSANFEHERERQTKLAALNNDLAEAVNSLKPFGDAITEITGLMNKAGENMSWMRETDSVNIEGLNDVAKNAIDSLSQYFQQLTGKQMVVSSGLRGWGGHVSGNKFDVVDDGSSEILEQNKDGIRDKIIEYARSIGLQVLDEYTNPSANATAGHLDFDAAGFTGVDAAAGNMIDSLKLKARNLHTEAGREIYKAILKLYEDAENLVKDLAEAKGDSSKQQKAAITRKYNDMIAAFTVNKMTDAAKNAAKVRDYEIMKIDAAQAKQKATNGLSDLEKEQEVLVANVTTGNTDITEAMKKLNASYTAKTEDALRILNSVIGAATAEGYDETARKVAEDVRNIKETLQKGLSSLITALDNKLQNEIQRIESDVSLTSMEKESRIRATKAENYNTRIAALKEKLPSATEAEVPGIKQAIADTQTLKDNLLRLNDVNYMVGVSFRQSFEDGLLNFLTEGINKCKSLGDAVRNLAVAVLNSIQRIYAEALTKNIMNIFNLGSYGGNSNSGSSTYKFPTSFDITKPFKFAEGGTVDSGIVRGPGTGTSDNILAYLGNFKKFIGISNGEYVIKSAVVKKFGTNFFDKLNSGLIPRDFFNIKAKFATGGSLLNRTVPGVQDIAASLTNNNSTSIPLKIINLYDQNDIGKYLQTASGEKVLINFVNKNNAMLRRLLK